MLLKTASGFYCTAPSNVIYRDSKLHFLSLQDTDEYIAVDMFALENITSSGSLGKKERKNNGKLADTCRHLNWAGQNVTSFPHVPLVSSLHEECKE